MPNRIIKESICTSDTIDNLTWFEEVFFYRLTVNCDDYGRFDGREAVLKSRLFPLKPSVTDKLILKTLERLSDVGLVLIYYHDDKRILQLQTWEKHQTIRNKKSKYPQFDSTCTQLKSIESNCNQLNANVTVIQSNPIRIQSESKSNPYGEFDDKKLLKTFMEYEEMRKNIKSPMTDKARGVLVGELKKLSNDTETQIKILEQSILKNWKSVYPLDEKKKQNPQHQFMKHDYNIPKLEALFDVDEARKKEEEETQRLHEEAKKQAQANPDTVKQFIGSFGGGI